LEKEKKKAAVVRTQKWRLRVKLSNPTDTEINTNMENDEAETCEPEVQEDTLPFTNRMAEHRALKKAKNSLPATPSKKAHLIKKLASSPRCSKILQKP